MASNQGRAHIIIVAGPTAAGKSEVACALAERFAGEVVGADSRQVFRGMDVGTAKPSAEMRRRVPHHLVDVVDPDVDFDAAAWNALASEAVGAIGARNRLPIVCGGTGLYLRALLRGIFPGPSADAGLRRSLENEERNAPGSLHERLRRCDPKSAGRIHANDRVRLVRALEVFELTGRPISRWHEEQREADGYEVLFLEVDPGYETLCRRIETRAAAMLSEGLVEELKGLRARYGRHPRAFSAIGYREAGLFLDGALAEHELAGQIGRATQRYAKRQRTWLRAQPHRRRIDARLSRDTCDLVGEFVAKAKGMR